MALYHFTLPPTLKTLMAFLQERTNKVRIVGGYVRDSILGLPSNDIDLTTDLLPEEAISHLQRRFTVIPTGLRYGTVTCIVDGHSYEITTLRRDVECYGRDAKVAYTDSFEEDARRRDFTINALSYDGARVFDYFHGMEHLQTRKVAFIGDPHERITEDYLRMMRFFRFTSRYAHAPDEAARDAICALKYNLVHVSMERIGQEITKFGSKALYCFALMEECGLWEVLLPGMRVLLAPINHGHQLSYQAALAVLLRANDQQSVARAIESLRLSSGQVKQVLLYLQLIEAGFKQDHYANLRRWWYRDPDSIDQAIAVLTCLGFIQEAQSCEYKTALEGLARRTFPISGNDLIAWGFSGSEIGRIKEHLLQAWLASDMRLSKAELHQIAMERSFFYP